MQFCNIQQKLKAKLIWLQSLKTISPSFCIINMYLIGEIDRSGSGLITRCGDKVVGGMHFAAFKIVLA